MLKAFYGRYYNNLADGFPAINPGGQSIAEYNFLDQNRNQRYDGPSELGTLRLRVGGDSTLVDPDFKTPYTEEISGSFEIQLPGESSARFTYVRKNDNDFASFYVTNLVTAWIGNVNVPTRQTIGATGEALALLDVPDAIADQTNGLYANYPDGNFNYDTIEVAYKKRVSQSSSCRPAPTTSGATISGRRRTTRRPSAPARCPRIRSASASTSRRTRLSRPVRRRRCGTTSCWAATRSRGEIGFAANWRIPERLPVLADRRRRRHLPGAEPLELRGATSSATT